VSWQREHERLMDELNTLAGCKVYNFARDTAHLTGEQLEHARLLNELNGIAVENYYKEKP
jgi:hypothetical protein